MTVFDHQFLALLLEGRHSHRRTITHLRHDAAAQVGQRAQAPRRAAGRTPRGCAGCRCPTSQASHTRLALTNWRV
jgi:hypothetical protein